VDTWPLFDLSISSDDLELHAVRDAEIEALAELFPDDAEQDPRAERFGGLEPAVDRRRLFAQGIWRSRGTWSPSSWCLDLAVLHQGRLVGLQSLEADDFLLLRTVDSGSWLSTPARGRGIGVAMRTAVLALAFDHLGAQHAISSASQDNAASLGVSRRIGYADNGLSVVRSPNGVDTLQHVRLTREKWEASGRGAAITVRGLDRCGAWFGI
jgi:RimJ/RimL family protein N-acetyltransferase